MSLATDSWQGLVNSFPSHSVTEPGGWIEHFLEQRLAWNSALAEPSNSSSLLTARPQLRNTLGSPERLGGLMSGSYLLTEQQVQQRKAAARIGEGTGSSSNFRLAAIPRAVFSADPPWRQADVALPMPEMALPHGDLLSPLAVDENFFAGPTETGFYSALPENPLRFLASFSGARPAEISEMLAPARPASRRAPAQAIQALRPSPETQTSVSHEPLTTTTTTFLPIQSILSSGDGAEQPITLTPTLQLPWQGGGALEASLLNREHFSDMLLPSSEVQASPSVGIEPERSTPRRPLNAAEPGARSASLDLPQGFSYEHLREQPASQQTFPTLLNRIAAPESAAASDAPSVPSRARVQAEVSSPAPVRGMSPERHVETSLAALTPWEQNVAPTSAWMATLSAAETPQLPVIATLETASLAQQGGEAQPAVQEAGQVLPQASFDAKDFTTSVRTQTEGKEAAESWVPALLSSSPIWQSSLPLASETEVLSPARFIAPVTYPAREALTTPLEATHWQAPSLVSPPLQTLEWAEVSPSSLALPSTSVSVPEEAVSAETATDMPSAAPYVVHAGVDAVSTPVEAAFSTSRSRHDSPVAVQSSSRAEDFAASLQSISAPRIPVVSSELGLSTLATPAGVETTASEQVERLMPSVRPLSFAPESAGQESLRYQDIATQSVTLLQSPSAEGGDVARVWQARPEAILPQPRREVSERQASLKPAEPVTSATPLLKLEPARDASVEVPSTSRPLASRKRGEAEEGLSVPTMTPVTRPVPAQATEQEREVAGIAHRVSADAGMEPRQASPQPHFTPAQQLLEPASVAETIPSVTTSAATVPFDPRGWMAEPITPRIFQTPERVLQPSVMPAAGEPVLPASQVRPVTAENTDTRISELPVSIFAERSEAPVAVPLQASLSTLLQTLERAPVSTLETSKARPKMGSFAQPDQRQVEQERLGELMEAGVRAEQLEVLMRAPELVDAVRQFLRGEAELSEDSPVLQVLAEAGKKAASAEEGDLLGPEQLWDAAASMLREVGETPTPIRAAAEREVELPQVLPTRIEAQRSLWEQLSSPESSADTARELVQTLLSSFELPSSAPASEMTQPNVMSTDRVETADLQAIIGSTRTPAADAEHIISPAVMAALSQGNESLALTLLSHARHPELTPGELPPTAAGAGRSTRLSPLSSELRQEGPLAWLQLAAQASGLQDVVAMGTAPFVGPASSLRLLQSWAEPQLPSSQANPLTLPRQEESLSARALRETWTVTPQLARAETANVPPMLLTWLQSTLAEGSSVAEAFTQVQAVNRQVSLERAVQSLSQSLKSVEQWPPQSAAVIPTSDEKLTEAVGVPTTSPSELLARTAGSSSEAAGPFAWLKSLLPALAVEEELPSGTASSTLGLAQRLVQSLEGEQVEILSALLASETPLMVRPLRTGESSSDLVSSTPGLFVQAEEGREFRSAREALPSRAASPFMQLDRLPTTLTAELPHLPVEEDPSVVTAPARSPVAEAPAPSSAPVTRPLMSQPSTDSAAWAAAQAPAAAGTSTRSPEALRWLASDTPVYDEEAWSESVRSEIQTDASISERPVSKPPERGPSLDQLVRNLERMFSTGRGVDAERASVATRASEAMPTVGPSPSWTSGNERLESPRVMLGKIAEPSPAVTTYASPRSALGNQSQTLPTEPMSQRDPLRYQPVEETMLAPELDQAAEVDAQASSLTESLARTYQVPIPGTSVASTERSFTQVLLQREPVAREVSGEAQEVFMAPKEESGRLDADHDKPRDDDRTGIDARGLEMVVSELRWRLELHEKWDDERE